METKPEFDLTDILKAVGKNIEKLNIRIDERIKKVTGLPGNINNFTYPKGNYNQYPDMWNYFDTALKCIPKYATMRPHLDCLKIYKTVWFKKGVTHQNMDTFPGGPAAFNEKDGASLLSLPCGQTAETDNPYKYNINLFEFPVNAKVSKHVIEIYMIYVILHELAHVYSLVPLKTKDKHKYVLENGENAKDYINNFDKFIEKYGPFGEYTEKYNKNNKEWLDENWADASAAYFMGFIMHQRLDFKPLPKPVAEYLHTFYNSKVIIDR
jgi:hypothetical protein